MRSIYLNSLVMQLFKCYFLASYKHMHIHLNYGALFCFLVSTHQDSYDLSHSTLLPCYCTGTLGLGRGSLTFEKGGVLRTNFQKRDLVNWTELNQWSWELLDSPQLKSIWCLKWDLQNWQFADCLILWIFRTIGIVQNGFSEWNVKVVNYRQVMKWGSSSPDIPIMLIKCWCHSPPRHTGTI